VLIVACSNSTRAETSIAAPTSAALTLVALGDSIPFNSSADCSGCIGYVDQYKDAIAKATGKPVKVANLSSHNGLTSAGLVDALKDPNVRASVAAADAITVSIGFNDAPMLVDDDPCDGASGDTKLELYTDACINDWADTFAQRYKIILDDIKQLRGDKPTLLTVINIYDQWLGFSQNSADINAHIAVVKTLLERQNAAICRVAADHGALCADLHSAFNGPNHDQPSGTLLGPEYAHPSQAGNDLIAKTLKQLGFTPFA
jgi:lysophospholipase L1-like esterase